MESLIGEDRGREKKQNKRSAGKEDRRAEEVSLEGRRRWESKINRRHDFGSDKMTFPARPRFPLGIGRATALHFKSAKSFSSRTADSLGSKGNSSWKRSPQTVSTEISILFFSNNSIVYFFLSFRAERWLALWWRSRSFLSFFLSFGVNWDFLSSIWIRRNIKEIGKFGIIFNNRCTLIQEFIVRCTCKNI